MFPTFLLICIPILFILIGAVAALSFARDPAPSETGRAGAAAGVAAGIAEGATTAVPAGIAPGLAPRPAAVLFRPRSRAAAERPVSSAELIAALEAHLRHERLAAQNFTRDPSPQTLWVN